MVVIYSEQQKIFNRDFFFYKFLLEQVHEKKAGPTHYDPLFYSHFQVHARHIYLYMVVIYSEQKKFLIETSSFINFFLFVLLFYISVYLYTYQDNSMMFSMQKQLCDKD
jgi:hypothetical protein